MKKLIPLCLVLILNAVSINSFAQKCDLEKNEIDGFTKEPFKQSSRLRISEKPFWCVQMEQKGSKYFFTFSVEALTEIREIMAKGTKLLVKLDDGSVMEFTSETDIKPAFKVEGGNNGGMYTPSYVVTQWDIRVPVTEDQIKKFAGSPVALIRTTVADKEYNMPDPHGRYTKKVMANASCMLEK